MALATSGVTTLWTSQPRAVALRAPSSRYIRFYDELARRLQAEANVRVTIELAPSSNALPRSVELLLQLERLLLARTPAGLSKRVDPPRPSDGSDREHDITIDFCPGETPGGQVLGIFYDGQADETALFGALLHGRVSVLTVRDNGSGEILSEAIPATDNASTIVESYECVLSRLLTLLVATVGGWGSSRQDARPTPQAPQLAAIVRHELKSLAHIAARKLYHLCCHAPHWRTCWRRVDGDGLWSGTLGNDWKIIPDPGSHFYADPFPFMHEGKEFVFVEDLDHRTNKGVISVIPFDEHGPAGPARPVLEENWHLSYPFVFRHGDHIWMLPESSANRSLTLYRADPFPTRWVKHAELLSDVELSDATIVEHDGLYWMLAATRDGGGSWSDTLSAFFARDFQGPWTPHPANPLLIDQRMARPAGAFVKRNGTLWRPVQDCSHGYGTGVGLAEVTRLDRDGFEQRLHTIVKPAPGWPGHRFHTFNRAGRLETIDGSAHSPRNRLLARRLQGWSGRRNLGETDLSFSA